MDSQDEASQQDERGVGGAAVGTTPSVVRVDDDVTARHDATTTDVTVTVLAPLTSNPPPRPEVLALARPLVIVLDERVAVLPSAT